MTEYIDISVPLRPGMATWPGDPPIQIRRTSDLDRGDECNLTTLALSVHAGTHVDAPLHYLPAGCAINRMPLDATVGPARVVEIRDPAMIRPEELSALQIGRGQRILFKTTNSDRCWRMGAFCEDFVFLSRPAAEYLVSCEVKTVGIDYLSIGGLGQDGRDTHAVLMRAGVWIIEGLDLSAAPPGTYELICLPLRLTAEGAPARAVLRALPAAD